MKLRYAGGSRDSLYNPEFTSDSRIWADEEVATELMDWTEIHRLPFFIQSQYYSEYRLCRQLELEGRSEWVEPLTVSVFLVSPCCELRCVFSQYMEFQGFCKFLSDTVGISQLRLWLSLASTLPTSIFEPDSCNHLDTGCLLAIRKHYRELLETLCLVSGHRLRPGCNVVVVIVEDLVDCETCSHEIPYSCLFFPLGFTFCGS